MSTINPELVYTKGEDSHRMPGWVLPKTDRDNIESSGYKGNPYSPVPFNIISGFGTEAVGTVAVSEEAAKLMYERGRAGTPISVEEAVELTRVKPKIRAEVIEPPSYAKPADANPITVSDKKIKVKIEGIFGKITTVYSMAFRHKDTLIMYQTSPDGLFYEPPSDLKNHLRVTIEERTYTCLPMVHAPLPDGKVALTVFLIDERD